MRMQPDDINVPINHFGVNKTAIKQLNALLMRTVTLFLKQSFLLRRHR